MKNRKETPCKVEGLAAETEQGVDQREMLPKRIERYSSAKRQALAMTHYIENNVSHQHKLATQISQCAEYLLFRDYYTVDQVKLAKASFCKKHLLCPLCAIRRGSKLLSRYLERYQAEKARDGLLRPYLVTLTVKDGEDLAERFNHLKTSVQKYHKRRHRHNAPCQAAMAEGAVWSYEVKRGKNSGSWHPHVHAIWLCRVPPSQSELSDEWHSITGDSYIVDVSPIDETDPVKGFLEVFKYAVKFSDQPHEDTWSCYLHLKGKRLIGSFGAFYGIPEPDDLLDDPLEGLPYHEYFYKYTSAGYSLSL